MDPTDIIAKSSALRGKNKPREAIDLVSSKIDEISDTDDTYLLNAYHELVNAALECGSEEEALEYAKKGSQEDPDLPLFKKVIKEYG